MFQQNEFELINKEFQNLQKKRMKKITKIWGKLLVITIILIVLAIVIFPKQFNNAATVWILPTYGGMALLGSLTGFLISIKYTSEKPFFEYLFPEIIQKINLNEGLYLEYEAYTKQDKEFNKDGGLFTRFAAIRVRRRLVGYTEEQLKYKIYDCTMTTSSGNNKQTHFDGSYFIIDKSVLTKLQIRTNGSPKQKGVKFEKQDDIEDFRVYKELGVSSSNLDHKYLRFMESLKTDLNKKRIYLSVVEGQIHLAIWYRKHPIRKQKQVTLEVLNNYALNFLDDIKMINQLANIDQY